jgi:hypothetical protein
MHLLQHYFDAIDPAIYGPLLDAPPKTDTLPDGAGGMNFMEVVGVGDSFTPPISMAAYAGAAHTDLLTPPCSPEPCDPVLPVWANDMVDDLITYTSAAQSKCSDEFSAIFEQQGFPVPACVGPNRPEDNPTHTRVTIQHPPCLIDADCSEGVPTNPSFDGHFVVYRNQNALAEMLSFLHSWSLTGTALVIPAGSNAP